MVGNLFASFVIQEQAIQAEPGYFSDMSASDLLQSPPGLGRVGFSRQGGPRHISLEARKIRSIAEIAASQRTPGSVASANRVPMTPALLPDLPANAMEKIAAANARIHESDATKAPIQGESTGSHVTANASGTTESPFVGSPTPKVPQRSQTMDEASVGHNLDYFSVRRRSSVSGDEQAAGMKAETGVNLPAQEAATDPTSTAATQAPSQVNPTTPAASSGHAAPSLKFMGKFKAFGKPKKAGGLSENAESADATVASSTPDTEPVSRLFSSLERLLIDVPKTIAVKPPTPTLFESLMAKPLTLPTYNDVPPVNINPLTGIIISQASSEAASGWAPVYRGLYSTQSELEDVEILEHELPDWILEFLLNNKVAGVVGGGGPGGTHKFNFMVVPWKGGESTEELPDLLSSQSRLTASKFLRVRKILTYVGVFEPYFCVF